MSSYTPRYMFAPVIEITDYLPPGLTTKLADFERHITLAPTNAWQTRDKLRAPLWGHVNAHLLPCNLKKWLQPGYVAAEFDPTLCLVWQTANPYLLEHAEGSVAPADHPRVFLSSWADVILDYDRVSTPRLRYSTNLKIAFETPSHQTAVNSWALLGDHFEGLTVTDSHPLNCDRFVLLSPRRRYFRKKKL